MTNLESQYNNNFQHRKEQFLNKKDKSSAGKIDKHCIDICNILNNNFNEYYTTSSCSGRCFLYKGNIGKSTNFTSLDDNDTSSTGMFVRYRVTHDKITNAGRYFDLNTLDDDPTGGGDEINQDFVFYSQKQQAGSSKEDDGMLWLRYEPFILHVSCLSLQAAYNLLQITRRTFKNIGLTSWSMKKHNEKYLIAIWGDEFLDIPLTTNDDGVFLFKGREQWLADLVNDRQARNWIKIHQLEDSLQEVITNGGFVNHDESTASSSPKRHDIIGDVALFHLPNTSNEEAANQSIQELKQTSENLLSKNKSINICVARTNALSSYSRSPSSTSLITLASRHENRSIHPSLLTTHVEYSVPCYIDITNTFFTPRMSFERQRIINQMITKQQSSQGKEHVFIPFAGCGMEAFQIAYKNLYKSITILELNPYAIRCLHRSLQTFIKNYNKKHTKMEDRCIYIHEGNVLNMDTNIAKTRYYDRIIAPRPKYNDSPDINEESDTVQHGIQFLKVLLPLLKINGICHWYDFCAYHELIFDNQNKKCCNRIQDMIVYTFTECGLDEDGKYDVEFIEVVNVTSVAKKQYRICVDFRIVALYKHIN